MNETIITLTIFLNLLYPAMYVGNFYNEGGNYYHEWG